MAVPVLHGVVRTVLLIALLLASFTVAAQERTAWLTEAQASIELPDGSVQQRPVTLPFQWDAHFGGQAGRATFTIPLPPPGPEPEAIHIPRLGNTARIDVDGQTLAVLGEPGNAHHSFTKQPRLVRLPPATAGPRELVITIDAQPARRGGLSAVQHGPYEEVAADYAREHVLRVTIYIAVGLASAVLGGVALLLWLRQRDRLYLLFAVCEVLWAFQALDVQFDISPLPWPWWGIMMLSARGLAVLGILKFALKLLELERGTLRRVCDIALVLLVPALTLALTGIAPGLEQLALVALELLVVWTAVTVFRHGWRSPSTEQRVLAWAMVAAMLFVLHDLIVRVLLPYIGPLWLGWSAHASHTAGISLARFAWPLFGFALMWTITERIWRTSDAAAAVHRSLEEKLAQREQQLQAAFAQRVAAERQQVELAERQRLMRDMHDGLGSQLVGALQLAQDSRVPAPMVARAVQEAVDNLRLTVDAMQDSDGNIATLLGAIRYRLAPRFASSGIALQWDVGPLPTPAGWGAQNARHLQLLLYEAMSNLLTHSCASAASLRAHQDPMAEGIRIVLTDNGIGIDTAAAGGGHGLANMRARAEAIGALLHLHADDEGTRIELLLPLGSETGREN